MYLANTSSATRCGSAVAPGRRWTAGAAPPGPVAGGRSPSGSRPSRDTAVGGTATRDSVPRLGPLAEVDHRCILPWTDAYVDLLGSVSEDGQRILRLPHCEGRNSGLDRIEQNGTTLLIPNWETTKLLHLKDNTINILQLLQK